MLLYKTKFEYANGGSNPDNHVASYNPMNVSLINGAGSPWIIDTDSMLKPAVLGTAPTLPTDNTDGQLKLGALGMEDGEIIANVKLTENTAVDFYIRTNSSYNYANPIKVTLDGLALNVYHVGISAKAYAMCPDIGYQYGDDVTIQIRYVFNTVMVFVNGDLKCYTAKFTYPNAANNLQYAYLESRLSNAATSAIQLVFKTWATGASVLFTWTEPGNPNSPKSVDLGFSETDGTLLGATEALYDKLIWLKTTWSFTYDVNYVNADDHARGLIITCSVANCTLAYTGGSSTNAQFLWTNLEFGSLSVDSYFQVSSVVYGTEMFDITSVSNMNSRVAELVNDATCSATSSKLTTAVQRAILEVWNAERWPEKDHIDYIPLIDGEMDYSIPVYFGPIDCMIYKGEVVDFVKSKGPYIFRNLTSNSGQPCQVALRGTQLKIFPAPSLDQDEGFHVLEVHHQLRIPYAKFNVSSFASFITGWANSDYPPLNADAVEAAILKAAIYCMRTIKDYDSGLYQDCVQAYNAKMYDARHAAISNRELPSQFRITM